MYAPCRPRFKFDAREYRPDAPQEDALLREQLDNVSLEPYVRERNTPAPVPLHTRLPRRLPLLTAEPLEPPKPAVTYRDKETQTEPVVVVSAREVAAQDLYMSYVRSEAAELRSDKIRLQREVDALTLDMQKLSVELHAARSAEERRLAEDKRRLEQLERAKEKTRLEQLERAAEKRTLVQHKMHLEQLERVAEDKIRKQLEQKAYECTNEYKIHQLLQPKAREPVKPVKPGAPAQAAKKPVNAQPVKAAQALPRSRTFNTNNNRAAGK